MMELEIRTLRADEIECRCQQVTEKGYILLLYKDARVDQRILDETFGILGWQRDHKELKGNIYCGISVYDNDKKQWVTKWDCGAESNTEKEKGEASDSFKRAGFNWGIGRELYTSPFIWIDSIPEELDNKNGKVVLKSSIKFTVSKIGYDKERNINELEIKNNKGQVRFKTYSKSFTQPTTHVTTPKGTNTPETTQKATEEQITIINTLVTLASYDSAKILTFYNVKTYNELTEKQAKQVINTMKKECSDKGIPFSEVE